MKMYKKTESLLKSKRIQIAQIPDFGYLLSIQLVELKDVVFSKIISNITSFVLKIFS